MDEKDKVINELRRELMNKTAEADALRVGRWILHDATTDPERDDMYLVIWTYETWGYRGPFYGLMQFEDGVWQFESNAPCLDRYRDVTGQMHTRLKDGLEILWWAELPAIPQEDF